MFPKKGIGPEARLGRCGPGMALPSDDEEETEAVVEKSCARDGHTPAVTDEVPIWVSPASLGKPKAEEATELSPASGFASILLPPKPS